MVQDWVLPRDDGAYDVHLEIAQSNWERCRFSGPKLRIKAMGLDCIVDKFLGMAANQVEDTLVLGWG